MSYKHNCTKGPVEVSKMLLGPNEKDRRSGFVVNGPDNGDGMLPARICDMRCHGDTQYAATKANASLIAEAFNILHETGMTPRELADLLERLAELLTDIQNRDDDRPRELTHGEYDDLCRIVTAYEQAEP